MLAFGSRASWTAKDYSDLDLAVMGEEPLSLRTVSALDEALGNSDLPFKVDVVDWARTDDAFRAIIRRDAVTMQPPTTVSEVDGRARIEDWSTMPFSEAFVVNPAVPIERGSPTPFVDMAAVDPTRRAVRSARIREFRGSGSRFQHGDTLFARITPCLENGKIARYSANSGIGDVAHGSTEFIVVRGRPGVTDSEYAFYAARSNLVREYAIGQMTGTSGRQRVPTDALAQLDVPLPPLSEQRAIAHVLGTLDDKIELNRRMNETLEAKARALFKSWFVDFDPVRAKLEGRDTGLPGDIADLFPDRLVDSELGEIPEGWEVGRLGDVAALRRRGVDPASVATDTPYIGLADMPRGSIALTDWGGAGSVFSRKSAFEAGDILFGKLRPYFHKVGIAPVDGVCSTDIVVLGAREPKWSAFVLACVSSSAFVAHTSQAATGTRMPRTSWKAMNRYDLCRPMDDVAAEFQRLVTPILRRIVGNIHESRTLGALRDTLLPKLISGELRLAESKRAEAEELRERL
ncbi:restriction endonuclease subunit S [Candidatus Palauibacter sp.]|uniref:restriction endonuclease subunit S n=1 Tax=Candidatus Palauibacter sp. TaxID=3101350 RepID=UPI003B52D107